jgi:peptidoglycan/LPS O-acetylase OafA/YrhL
MAATPRFALIDAMRGIAALAVVAYHVYWLDLLPHAASPLAEPFHSVFAYGYLGVYIFFVISGFVIAYSVRDVRITPAFVGRFALRRSIRLDPPYWVAIAGAIAVMAVESPDRALPSAGDVAAHVLYLQQFVGVPHLIGVFWTLCLEIQFYLAYVVLMLVAQRVARGQVWFVFGPLWIVSLAIATNVLRLGHPWFLWAWPYFFLGAITAWHRAGRISSRAWIAITGATCLALMWSRSRWLTADDAPERIGVVAASALVLFLAGRKRRDGRSPLELVTLGRPMQYLGRISYSLYLTHVLVASLSASYAIRWLALDSLGSVELIALLLGCTAASVVVAHILHVVVERPAHRLSRRVRVSQTENA